MFNNLMNKLSFTRKSKKLNHDYSCDDNPPELNPNEVYFCLLHSPDGPDRFIIEVVLVPIEYFDRYHNIIDIHPYYKELPSYLRSSFENMYQYTGEDLDKLYDVERNIKRDMENRGFVYNKRLEKIMDDF